MGKMNSSRPVEGWNDVIDWPPPEMDAVQCKRIKTLNSKRWRRQTGSHSIMHDNSQIKKNLCWVTILAILKWDYNKNYFCQMNCNLNNKRFSILIHIEVDYQFHLFIFNSCHSKHPFIISNWHDFLKKIINWFLINFSTVP